MGKTRYIKLLKSLGGGNGKPPTRPVGLYAHINWPNANKAGLFTNKDIDQLEDRDNKAFYRARERMWAEKEYSYVPEDRDTMASKVFAKIRKSRPIDEE